MIFSRILQTCFIVSISMIPFHVMGDDNYTSKLMNQSKQNGSDGYYLVRDTVIGENDCVNVDGSDKLNPGDSDELKIKKECKWGVVKYKIVGMKDNKNMGYLSHSFHDGKFSIEITSLCKGSECNFYGLNPDQNRR